MTAPTTEQVREARERIEARLADPNWNTADGESVIALRADIRTVLDALAAKDEPEGGPMPPFETPCAECGREWGEHCGEECPNGRTKFRPAPSAPAEPPKCPDCGSAYLTTGAHNDGCPRLARSYRLPVPTELTTYSFDPFAISEEECLRLTGIQKDELLRRIGASRSSRVRVRVIPQRTEQSPKPQQANLAASPAPTAEPGLGIGGDELDAALNGHLRAPSTPEPPRIPPRYTND